MKGTNHTTELKEAIILLQNKQEHELLLLKEQFHRTCESLKPMNLLKSTFKASIESPGIKDTILNTSVGLATGYFSKLLFVSTSHNPFIKILGMALQFGITKIVAKHPEGIKSIGKGIVSSIRNKWLARFQGRSHTEPGHGL